MSYTDHLLKNVGFGAHIKMEPRPLTETVWCVCVCMWCVMSEWAILDVCSVCIV